MTSIVQFLTLVLEVSLRLGLVGIGMKPIVMSTFQKLGLISIGQYCVNATLWDVSNGAMNYVDVEYPCFTITASNNGGGNNGRRK